MKPDWPTVPLGDVLQPVDHGETPQAGKLYQQLGVRLWGEGAYARETIDGSQTRYPTFTRVKSDDVVLNKIWARNGSVAVVREELAGCYVSTEFPTFAPNLDRLEPRWMHWLTKTPGFWQQCDERARGTSGKNRIRPEQFLRVEIPLPPVTEQRRIVARIEQLAAQIDGACRLRHQATEESEALLNCQLSAIVSELEKHGGSRKLEGLLLDACYGTSTKCSYDRADCSVPVLRIPNVASERVNFADLKFGVLSDADLEKALVREGDILVVRTNGSADLVGRCAVVPSTSEPTAFASYMIRLRCDHNVVSPAYLQLMLKHLPTTGGLIDFARTTAGQYNVSLGRLRNASLPVPPLPEQRRIVGYLDGLAGQVAAMARLQSETADALLPSILDKAFKGEL